MAEKTTLARPYAEAVYQSAVADDSVDKWSDMLMVLEQIAGEEVVRQVIADPNYDQTQIVDMFVRLGADYLDEKAINLVKLLADNQRFDLIADIRKEFEAARLDDQGHLEAEVISAFAVNASQKKLIASRLKEKFGKEVSIHTRIDKSLLAGIIIKVGDLVIDGSVSTQLDKMSKALVR